MSYTVTTVFTRPDTSVEWFKQDRSVEGYTRSDHNVWVNSGKKQRPVETESADGLNLTLSSEFLNEDAYLEYINDSSISNFRLARHMYNFENDVTWEITITES